MQDMQERTGQKGFSARLIPRELAEYQAAAEAEAEAAKTQE